MLEKSILSGITQICFVFFDWNEYVDKSFDVKAGSVEYKITYHTFHFLSAKNGLDDFTQLANLKFTSNGFLCWFQSTHFHLESQSLNLYFDWNYTTRENCDTVIVPQFSLWRVCADKMGYCGDFNRLCDMSFENSLFWRLCALVARPLKRSEAEGDLLRS